ncbi:MAG: polyketide synthase dehydratase domain-containing protein [Hyphomicrobiaceae bacterium]|nr:polyketide synthase dehydratase domain-containing protein [Hyphomicrobiaceae bacterium]
MKLPLYPWQNKSYKSVPTREAIELLAPLTAPHPLLGQQLHGDSYVWLSHLDTARLPYLQDHKVDGKVILPGAGFAEMALAAARQWLNTDRVELRDMDIENALRLGEEGAREVRTRLSVKNGTVVIDSRVRHNDDDWLKHAECRVSAIPGDLVPKEVAPKLRQGPPLPNIARLYELCERHGLQFGPSFQRMIRCDELGEGELEVELAERLTLLDPVDGESSAYVLHPLDLDACFHGLNVLYDRLESEAGADKLAFIPVRFGVLRVYLAQVPVRSARIHILRSNARGGQCDFELFGANGELVATLQDARFRAAALVQRPVLERLSYSITHEILPYAEHQGETSAPDFDKIISFANAKVSEPGRRQEVERLCEQRQSLELAARRSAYDILRAICDKNGDLDMETLFSLPLSDAGNIANLDSSLDVGALAEIERDTMDLRLAMVSNLLAIAEQSGMAKEREGRWHLLEEHELPTQEQGFYARGEGLRELLKEDPRWIADIVLLNRAARWQSEFLGGRAQIDPSRRQAHHIYSGSLLEQMRGSSPVAGRHIDEVACLASQIIENWPRGKALRVVELGVGGGELTRKILPLISARHGRLVALDSNKTALARLNMSLGQCASFETVALDENLEAFGEAGPFDLLISANHLSFLPSPEALVPRLS